MKHKLLPLADKLLLRKRALIETINDQLKNISQIEHTRHRSVINWMVNLLAGLVAYTHQPKKPPLNLFQNRNFSISQGAPRGTAACCRRSSDSGGIASVRDVRSVRYCQKETLSFRQLRFKLIKVSRQRRPRSLRVPLLTLRFFTGSRRACSLPLVCKGISGRSSTNNNSALLR